eukprot:CAMPEP_0195048404 /NCGR_PEP_ID=MMETSP0347-20130606/46164_1 /TAXON_ID=2932 /ORGANISM="Alexandrium fundyense, Strain CCMP1719" /LENGTH=41 /DNA_ID= /DNA_START= /DNA_END= /DNA_ORIENTATION=
MKDARLAVSEAASSPADRTSAPSASPPDLTSCSPERSSDNS